MGEGKRSSAQAITDVLQSIRTDQPIAIGNSVTKPRKPAGRSVPVVVLPGSASSSPDDR